MFKKQPPKQRRTIVISFRFTPTESGIAKALAEHYGMSLSDVFSQAVRDAAALASNNKALSALLKEYAQ